MRAGEEGEGERGVRCGGLGSGGSDGNGDGAGGWLVGWSVRRWMHRGGAIGSEARGTQLHRQNPTSPINT